MNCLLAEAEYGTFRKVDNGGKQGIDVMPIGSLLGGYAESFQGVGKGLRSCRENFHRLELLAQIVTWEYDGSTRMFLFAKA